MTNLTGNGLNALQEYGRNVFNLPSFNFLLYLLSDKNFMFSFDYAAAYRNILLAEECFGSISYVYKAHAFIDFKLPFGLVQAAFLMQNWSVQMRDSFRFRWPRLFKPFLDEMQTFQQSDEDLSYLINNDKPLPLPDAATSRDIKEDFAALVDIASPQVNTDTWVQAFSVYFVNVIAKDPNWAKSSNVFDPSIEFVNSLDLPKIRWDKGQVYIDDNLEAEQNSLLIIHLMKHVMLFVFKQINIKTDLESAEVTALTRYLGWMVCLQRKSVKLPVNKQVSMINKINTFIDGKINILSGESKKKRFLYSGREIAAISGSLLHFSEIHFQLKPHLTPFYRLLDGYILAKRHHWDIYRQLNIDRKNSYIYRSLLVFRSALEHNDWVRFDCAINQKMTICRIIRTFADASGSPVPWATSAVGHYGVGGFSWDLQFAWQMPKHTYIPWLKNAGDSQSDPCSINTEELMTQMLNIWLIKAFFPDQLFKSAILAHVDNSGVDRWIARYAAKHAFQSKLLCLQSKIEADFKCKVTPIWISSGEMILSRADALSRFEYQDMLGIKVLKINRQLFRQFKADVELVYGTVYVFYYGLFFQQSLTDTGPIFSVFCRMGFLLI